MQRKSWKIRWFRIVSKETAVWLYYYKSRNDVRKPHGAISLNNAAVCEEKQKTKDFVFSVTAYNKVTYMQAADKEEYADWLEAIRKAIRMRYS